MREGYRQLRAAPLGEPARLVGLAILVGVVGGVGALVFRWLISVVRYFFTQMLLGPDLGWSHSALPYVRVVSPALGLLLVGVITTYFAREVRGHGVPQILEALALRGGRIRPRVGFFGILAPAITIGAEGSVGREGPIALIGAAFGSTLGQVLRLSDSQISLLVGCGAAAGIGATFNAPIAGALFGLEVVLGSYAMGALVPCFVASVTGVTIFDWIHGSAPVLSTPAYSFDHPFGVVFMLFLGLLAGGVGLAYTRGLTLIENLSEGFKINFVTRALIGGLLVGGIGFFLPQVLGVGYAAMGLAASGSLGIAVMLGLLAGKYCATLLTIGAGGSGGVFAPSLFLGVMLGGTYGTIVHGLFPGLTSSPALYAVAGMGAVFAASAQAPLTAATIILEMTGDYRLVTGVMAACAVSYLLYGSLARDSMYTVRLVKRGIQILRGTEVRPLGRVAVGAAMNRAPLTLDPDEDIQQAYQQLLTAGMDAGLVAASDGELVGVLEAKQVFAAVASGQKVAVHQIARKDVPVLTPESSLDDAMRRFGIYSVSLLPVVQGRGSRVVLGAVTQQAVLQAYYRHTVLTMEMQVRLDMVPAERQAHEGLFREVVLPDSWPTKLRLADVGRVLPRGTVVVAVTRGEDELVARGATELRAGDRVLLYATEKGDVEAATTLLITGRIDAGTSAGVFQEITLPQGCGAHTVRELSPALPSGVLLVSIRRNAATVVPSGQTELQPGDIVTLFGVDPEKLSRAQDVLLGRSPTGAQA